MKKNRQIGQRIKKFRENHYPSQKALADDLKVGQTVVSAWERGDNVPSSEAWAKLGNAAPYPDNVWFWEQAGMSKRALLSAAEKVMKERLAAVSVGGTKNVPCVRTTAQGTEELGHSLPLPAEWVPNPLSTFCLVVDENRAGLPVHPGDIIVLDTSCNDAKDLCPFWGRHVLIKADPRLIFPSDTKPEGKVGIDLRLGVLQCKEEAAGVEGRLISDDGLSWVACLSLISDSDAEDQSGNKGFVVGRLVEHPTETLRESLEQARAMESFEQFHASYPTEQVLAFQEKVRNEAPAKIRLNRYFEIVGIVLGWFRPGAKKAKE